MKARKPPDRHRASRVLVLVDESNVASSARISGRGLDWLKLRDSFEGEDGGREIIEMVIYTGLPPAMPEWQTRAGQERASSCIGSAPTGSSS